MKTLLALAAGAVAMYLMDREHGAQRRAELQEKFDRAKQMLRDRANGLQRSAETKPEVVSEGYVRNEQSGMGI